MVVAHRVKVADTEGVTRDISASGAYFELGKPFTLGEKIAFEIEFGKQGVNFILKCKGNIVRLEDRNGKSGVAVKITESMMESA